MGHRLNNNSALMLPFALLKLGRYDVSPVALESKKWFYSCKVWNIASLSRNLPPHERLPKQTEHSLPLVCSCPDQLIVPNKVCVGGYVWKFWKQILALGNTEVKTVAANPHF